MAPDSTSPTVQTSGPLVITGGLINGWLQSHDVSEASRAAYRRNIRNFERWNLANTIGAPNRQAIIDYKKYLTEAGYTACTQSNYLCAVREFFRFMERVYHFPSPTRDLKGIRHPSGHRKDALTLVQLHELLEAVPTTTTPMCLRDAAILNLAARTGLRGCEISRANVGDLRQKENHRVLYVQGKGHLEKDRFVVISDDCYKSIQKYLATRGALRPLDPLFTSLSDGCAGRRLGTTSLRKIAKFYFRKIGLDSPRISLHSLRHTALTLALSSGATLLETKEMARHDQVASTMIYAHTHHRLETAAELKLEQLLKSSPIGEAPK